MHRRECAIVTVSGGRFIRWCDNSLPDLSDLLLLKVHEMPCIFILRVDECTALFLVTLLESCHGPVRYDADARTERGGSAATEVFLLYDGSDKLALQMAVWVADRRVYPVWRLLAAPFLGRGFANTRIEVGLPLRLEVDLDPDVLVALVDEHGAGPVPIWEYTDAWSR